MATRKIKVVYILNIKARTVAKATAVVCGTVLACTVVGDIAAPFIEELAQKLKTITAHIEDVPVVVAVVDENSVEGPTTVDE